MVDWAMAADDARPPTPEDMRDAYRRFIANELDGDHKPSPSSSPESVPRGPAQSVKQDRRPGDE